MLWEFARQIPSLGSKRMLFALGSVPGRLEQLHMDQGEHQTGGESHQGQAHDDNPGPEFVILFPSGEHFIEEPWIELGDVHKKETDHYKGGNDAPPEECPKTILVFEDPRGPPFEALDQHELSQAEKDKIGSTEDRVAVQAEKG